MQIKTELFNTPDCRERQKAKCQLCKTLHYQTNCQNLNQSHINSFTHITALYQSNNDNTLYELVK